MAGLEKLNEVDFSNMTIADVRKLKNTALKNALTHVINRGLDSASHQNHGSHSDSVSNLTEFGMPPLESTKR